MNHVRHLWDYQWFRDLTILLVVAVLLLVAYSLRALLMPILIALALAYAFHPLISWLHEKARIPRWLSTTGLLAIVSTCTLSMLLWLAPQLINQTRNLFDRLPGYVHYAKQEMEQLKEWAQERAENDDDDSSSSTTQPATQAAQLAGKVPPEAQSVLELMSRTLEEGTDWPAIRKQAEDARRQAQSEQDKQGSGQQAQPSGSDSSSAAGKGSAADGASSDASKGSTQQATHAPVSSNDRGQATQEHAQSSQQQPASSQRQAAISSALQNFDLSTFGTMVAQVFNTGLAVVGVTISIGMYLVLAGMLLLLGFFFFSWKFDRILTWFDSFIPDRNRDRVVHILRRMDRAISAFVRGRLVQVSIITCVLCTGWAWVGVPYWLLLGVLGGLLNFVPYAAVLAWPVAILLVWIDTASGGSGTVFTVWQVFIWPSVVYIVAQSLDGWVVEPLVQGKATNLDPFTVLVAVIIGGGLLGIMGTIIAVPAAACLKILMQEVILPHIYRQIHGPQA